MFSWFVTSSPFASTHTTRSVRSRLAWLILCAAGLFAAASVHADPPARVGRVAQIEGSLQLTPAPEPGAPAAAPINNPRNWPVTRGDLLSTGNQSRAEITVGSTRIRLGENTRMLVTELDEQWMRLQLLDGKLTLRLRTDEAAHSTDVVAGPYRFSPRGPGVVRIDADSVQFAATAWRSDVQVDGAQSPITVRSGQRVALDPSGSRWRFVAPEADRFAAWAMADNDAIASNDWISPEMTGHEDLARYGDWQDSAEWGPIWFPRTVGADWAPYREGQWTWVAPWGWTWVDAAPWGFAPFHYGRWVQTRQRWGWVPGAYERRPVYAPALVSWIDTGGGVTMIRPGYGRPSAPPAWYPLAPREAYAPPYRAPRDHWDRFNRPHLPDGDRADRNPGFPPQRGPLPDRPVYGDAPQRPGTPPGWGNNGYGAPRGGGVPDAGDGSMRRRIPTPPARDTANNPGLSPPMDDRNPGGRGGYTQTPTPVFPPASPFPMPANGTPPHEGWQGRPALPALPAQPAQPGTPGRFTPPATAAMPASPEAINPPRGPEFSPPQGNDQRRRLPEPGRVLAPAPMVQVPVAPMAPVAPIGVEPPGLRRGFPPRGDARRPEPAPVAVPSAPRIEERRNSRNVQ